MPAEKSPGNSAQGGQTVLAAAGQILEASRNSENPELYAVFPYRLYGVGKPDIDVARATFLGRRFKGNGCWSQDDIQMAYLGMADEAAGQVTRRLAKRSRVFRFPAMWEPSNDEAPDMDHGGVGQMALQAMVLQTDGDRIQVLPAWPVAWDVDFKLHAPRNTTVHGVYRAGVLRTLLVTPSSRIRDVIVGAGITVDATIRRLVSPPVP
jgi:hypothetical protein